MTIISALSGTVHERFIELLGLFGLILVTYGAILLIKPLIKSNAEIRSISSYKNNSCLGNNNLEINEKLEKNLKQDRVKGFEGGMFIFIGFSFQLLEKSIEIVYPTKSMPQGINWFFYITLIIAFILLTYKPIKRMLRKKKDYEKGYSNTF